MDFLIELLLELVLEGSVEIVKSKRVSRIIRYPLIFLLALFFAAVEGLILFVGISMLKTSVLGGVIVIALAVVFLIALVIKIVREYIKRQN